jgi:hypothetical protein
MGNLLDIVNESVYGSEVSTSMKLVESVQDTLNNRDIHVYPKIQFIEVDTNRRSGDVIRGGGVMGVARSSKVQWTLLVPNKYDYKEFGSKLKKDEILVRLENSLTSTHGSSFLNATIAKLNLSTKTMTLPNESSLSGEDDTFAWDKAFRIQDIVIHLPFSATTN